MPTKKRPPDDDLPYYTQPRFKGSAKDVIRSFADAQRRMIRRLADDLRSDRYGRFGGRTGKIMAALAGSESSLLGHVDAFERAALEPGLGAPLDARARTVLANVIADSGFVTAADAREQIPTADEAKFDQGLTGKLVEEASDIADKLNDIGAAIPVIGRVFAGLAAIVRDIGIFARLVGGISGGDEAAEQVEKKLDFALQRLVDLLDGQERLGGGQSIITEIVQRIDRETTDIERKVLELAQLLGSTLVGMPWNVDPNRITTTPNEVPSRDVKQELHDIEAILRALYLIVVGQALPPPGGITPPGGSGGGGIPGISVPVIPDRPPLLDGRLKKIFVFEQDVFRPASANDLRVVAVRTPAFDLSGFVDLTQLRAGDIVEIETAVSVAGRPHRLFDRQRFDRPRLVTLADFARGENRLSGTDIRVTLRQPQSGDGFATPVEVTYQFVVESQ
ncbi:MAG: hypothetical protein ACRD15_06500 [Vicinamibacterales bacterium]